MKLNVQLISTPKNAGGITSRHTQLKRGKVAKAVFDAEFLSNF